MDPKTDDPRRSQPGSRSWEAEYFELAARDRHASLEPVELERMAMAAFLLGRETNSVDILTRAHQISTDRGDSMHASICGLGRMRADEHGGTGARRRLGRSSPAPSR